MPRAVAPAAAPADTFPVGSTVELRGLVSNAAANGRHVVVVQTPPDVADRGRINVCLDGDVKAVKRENVVPVPSAGVGSAPSSAAMAWLTPGFLSSVSLASSETLALKLSSAKAARDAYECWHGAQPPQIAFLATRKSHRCISTSAAEPAPPHHPQQLLANQSSRARSHKKCPPTRHHD